MCVKLLIIIVIIAFMPFVKSQDFFPGLPEGGIIDIGKFLVPKSFLAHSTQKKKRYLKMFTNKFKFA